MLWSAASDLAGNTGSSCNAHIACAAQRFNQGGGLKCPQEPRARTDYKPIARSCGIKSLSARKLVSGEMNARLEACEVYKQA